MNVVDQVVKVGGSLLDWPGLEPALAELLAESAESRAVLIVGGGGVVDQIRRLDQVHSLGEERSHHLAMLALDLTARLLASICPGLVVVESPEQFADVWRAGHHPLLAPSAYYEQLEAMQPDPLPHTWETTTDSIAARIAVGLGAEELVLLKRTTAPAGLDAPAAVRLGLVDPCFPRAVRGLARVSIRNLTDPAARTASLKLGPAVASPGRAPAE